MLVSKGLWAREKVTRICTVKVERKMIKKKVKLRSNQPRKIVFSNNKLAKRQIQMPLERAQRAKLLASLTQIVWLLNSFLTHSY